MVTTFWKVWLFFQNYHCTCFPNCAGTNSVLGNWTAGFCRLNFRQSKMPGRDVVHLPTQRSPTQVPSAALRVSLGQLRIIWVGTFSPCLCSYCCSCLSFDIWLRYYFSKFRKTGRQTVQSYGNRAATGLRIPFQALPQEQNNSPD